MRIPEKYVLASFLLWVTIGLSAQTTPPNPNPPPPGLAVDHGIFLLIVVGIIYGGYRKIITSK